MGKLEKRDKLEGKKLGKNAIKDLKALLKAKGKDPDKHDWSKAKTNIELADELRRYLNVM